MLPASEVYFKFIWDTNLLELLVHIHQGVRRVRRHELQVHMQGALILRATWHAADTRGTGLEKPALTRWRMCVWRA